MSSRSFNANINTTDQVNATLTNNKNIGITNIPSNKAGYNQFLLGSAQSTTALVDSTITPVINTDALPGWTVENSLAGTATVIRMFDSDTNENILKSDITNLYAIVNISKFTSVETLPFITLYTKPTGVGDHVPGVYHSKFFYNINILNQHIGVNEEVTIYNGLQEPSRGFTQRKIPLEFVTVIGQDVDGEVLKINFETSAFAVVNDVKLNVSTLGWETRNIKRNINLLSIEEQLPLNDATAANQVLSIASTDAIKTEMSSGEQKTKCMGSGTGFPMGTQFQLKTSGVGRLEVDINSGASTGDATAALQTSQLTQETSTATNTNTISLATASLDSKITQGAEQTLTEAQQVLCYGEVTAGPGTGELHPIHITSAGDVEVEIADFVKGQDTMAASFPVVIASDQSSLTIDGTVAVSSVSGTVAVSAISLPLPGGASSETTLSALNTKVTACDTGSIAGTVAVSSLPSITGTVAVSSVGGTVAVSATALPLPGGASTETTLSAINTKIERGTALSSGATNLQAQRVQIFGGYDAGGLHREMRTLKCDDNGVLETTDANITKGEDIIVGGSGGIQQVLMYGKTATGGNNLQPIELTGDRLIVDVQELNVGFTQNSGGSMTQAGAVQIYGGYDDGLGGVRKMRTLKTDDNGTLETVEKAVRTTPVLEQITITKAAGWGYSTAIDMGSYENLVVWGTINTPTGVGGQSQVWIEASATGAVNTWYMSNDKITVNTTAMSPVTELPYYHSYTNTAPFIRFARHNTRNDNADEVWDLNWCLS